MAGMTALAATDIYALQLNCSLLKTDINVQQNTKYWTSGEQTQGIVRINSCSELTQINQPPLMA